MEYEVIITRSALRDLEEIRTFIARDNPSAAKTFIQKLLDGAESLSSFPERGGSVTQRPGCAVCDRPSLLDYLPDHGAIAHGPVLRYWHGARERMRL